MIWLREQEIETLRRLSRQTRRTQSDFIREGIFMMARQLPHSAPAPTPESTELTPLEEDFIMLSAAGYLVRRIAHDLGISHEEVHALKLSVRRKLCGSLAS